MRPAEPKSLFSSACAPQSAAWSGFAKPDCKPLAPEAHKAARWHKTAVMSRRDDMGRSSSAEPLGWPAVSRVRRAAVNEHPQSALRNNGGAGSNHRKGGTLPMIRKLKSGAYRLYSRNINPKTGKRRNLGTFKTRAAAEKHERDVQYFKRAG